MTIDLLDRPATAPPALLRPPPPPAPGRPSPRWLPALRQALRTATRGLGHAGPGAPRPGQRSAPPRPEPTAGSWSDVTAALLRAADSLEQGWVQDAWFHVVEPTGRRRALGPLDLHRLGTGAVTGSCLVGAVVQTTGGPGQARSDLTSRTLDLLWDTLQDDLRRPGLRASGRAWPAAVRAARVRDLTRWNDAPGRTVEQVRGLVQRAAERVPAVAAGLATV